jgi:hypothetical protein
MDAKEKDSWEKKARVRMETEARMVARVRV